MSELTIERLFSNPPVLGELPSHVQCAPDGKHISWLRPASDDRERLDLWVYEVATQQSRCLLNATELDAGGLLTDAEKALKERKRQFSDGVTSYAWHPQARACLVIVAGMAYLVALETGQLSTLTQPGTRQTDIRLAPDGTHIAFVRDGNLFTATLNASSVNAEQSEPPTATQLTQRDHEQLSFGLPDFIAQEEMHRFEGYWFSSDSEQIIYTAVDESNVAVSQRYEIDAEEFRVVPQRYPFTGANNPIVKLAIQAVPAHHAAHTRLPAPTWVDWMDDPQDYLARVTVHAGALYVQCQNRAQTKLTLKRWQLKELAKPPEILLVETADTWLNLHNNLTPLETGDFLWTSARDGYEHLYFYGDGGHTAHQLTHGVGRVNQIVYADQARVFFLGWFSNPTEQQFYRCNYSVQHASSGPERSAGTAESSLTALTDSAAWHDVSFAGNGTLFVDRYSSPTLPAQLDFGRIKQDQSIERTTIASLAIEGDHPYAPYLEHHKTPLLGRFQTSDDETLYYRLTPPAGSSQANPARFPVVIYVYGGPGGQKVTSAWAPLLLQLFATAGIGVLEVDNRGTGNRSTGFDAPIHKRLGAVEVNDQLAGVEFLQTIPWADTQRLGVFGHSYGGYMTLMCLANAADTFKAGVSVAPVSAWELYDTHYTERYLSTPQANPEGYAQSAVFPWLSKLKGELLIIHGMADDNVLFTHSTRLFKALQDLGTPFQMMTYPGSKHALQEATVATHRFEMILRFFKEHL